MNMRMLDMTELFIVFEENIGSILFIKKKGFYMKKIITILLSVVIILSLSVSSLKANEIETPPDDPIGPDEYVETTITYHTGSEVSQYCNGCIVGVTPYFTAGVIRYNPNGDAWSYSVNWGGNITSFSKTTGTPYTTSDVSVSLTNVHFYVENYTLKVSYKVKISIGGTSSTSNTQYLTLKNNVH